MECPQQKQTFGRHPAFERVAQTQTPQLRETLNSIPDDFVIKDHFRASVQYGDLKGTASADRADSSGPEEFLRKRGLLSSGEFIVGIDFWAGENPGRHQDPVTVNFLLTEGAYDSVSAELAGSSGPLPVRRVAVDMGIAEFLGLFKRFSICPSPSGMLTDRSYSHPD